MKIKQVECKDAGHHRNNYQHDYTVRCMICIMNEFKCKNAVVYIIKEKYLNVEAGKDGKPHVNNNLIIVSLEYFNLSTFLKNLCLHPAFWCHVTIQPT